MSNCIYKNKVPPRGDSISLIIEGLEKETEKAFLILYQNKQYWIPKSQTVSLHSASKDKEYDIIVISKWIAETKGIDTEYCDPEDLIKPSAPHDPTDNWDADIPF
jgi:hypothetical protein